MKSVALVEGPSTCEKCVVEENTKTLVNLTEKVDGDKETQEFDSVSRQKLDNIMALLVDSGTQSPYQNDEAMDNLYDDLEFVDDCNRGERPDRHAVIGARMEELEFFKKMNVYRKVQRKDALASGASSYRPNRLTRTKEPPNAQISGAGLWEEKSEEARSPNTSQQLHHWR